MFTLCVSGSFSASHILEGYPGDCSRLHGHNFKVEAEWRGEKLDELGMLCDFKELKKILKEVLSFMDHRHLNDLDIFEGKNPTAENIARVLFDTLEGRAIDRVQLESVAVDESDSARARYCRKG